MNEKPKGKKNILTPAYARNFMLTYLINSNKGDLFDKAFEILEVIEKEVNKLSYEDCFVAMILASKFHEEEDYLSVYDGRNYYELENNLNDQYMDGTLQKITEQRVRPNKWTATALLARTFLYTGDWKNAEIQSTEVINNNSLYGLSILNDVFLKNNIEAIWQLQPVLNGPTNTSDGYHFIVPSSGPNEPVNPVYLSQWLLNNFEEKDKRRTDWIDSVTVDGTTYYYPFKYKVNGINDDVSEYQMILRLGEQYLIRAEARAEQGKVIDAEADLNTIRARAGLKNTTAVSQLELISAIQHERQVELFAEFGHRWLDLKRTGRVNGVMTLVTHQKGGIWNKNQQLYPIPLTEIQKDPNLVQNDGY